jgi:hypothetical protein
LGTHSKQPSPSLSVFPLDQPGTLVMHGWNKNFELENRLTLSTAPTALPLDTNKSTFLEDLDNFA